jgi:hypothetical protein
LGCSESYSNEAATLFLEPSLKSVKQGDIRRFGPKFRLTTQLLFDSQAILSPEIH